jgi:sodium/proline symporter
MSRAAAVLITLILYKIALIAIGIFYGRRTHSNEDFYLGGRRLSPVVAAISASASSSSAWTLLGVSGAAYAWGLSALWIFPSCVGGFFFNWYLVAPLLQTKSRQSGALTVTDMLTGPSGTRFRGAVSGTASVIILVSLGTYIASQFQGAGKAFTETFGISLTASILIGGGVVVFYTLLGGFWAVSVTDTLQGLLMAATSTLLPLFALLAVGGPGELLAGLSRVEVPGYLSLTRGAATVAGIGFVLGLLGIGLGYPGQPHVVNRFMALRGGEASLKQARRIAMIWAVTVYFGMLLLGLCGRILVPGLEDPEVIFVTLTNQLFPPVISGIMLAAVLSAIMSTADSQLLVAASAVTHDLRKGLKSTISTLNQSRIVVLLLSCAALLAALFGSQEIFSRVLFAWAAMGSAFGPLLLVILYRGQVDPRARLLAMLLGFLLSVGAFYLLPAGFAWKGAFERVFSFVIALGVAYLGTLVLQRSAKGAAGR